MELNKIKTTCVVNGKTFLILKLPLEEACTVFDHILQSYGNPFINLFTRLFIGSGESLKTIKASLKPDELEKVLLSYIKTAKPNQTFSTFELLINPQYVKHGETPILLNEVYADLGLKGMFQLCFNIIKVNFSDFLSSG